MSDGFFAMGGYAEFVWGSFGAAALVLLWNALSPCRGRRRVMQRLTEREDDAPPTED